MDSPKTPVIRCRECGSRMVRRVRKFVDLSTQQMVVETTFTCIDCYWKDIWPWDFGVDSAVPISSSSDDEDPDMKTHGGDPA